MASETINQQVLHTTITSIETHDLKDVFDMHKRRFILVERPAPSKATTPNEFPAFPTVPPLELLPKITKKTPLLRDETISDFHPQNWRNSFGRIVSVDAEYDYNHIDSNDYPEYISEYPIPEEGKKLLTYLHNTNYTNSIFSIYECCPLRSKKTKKFASFKFSHDIDIHYKSYSKEWDIQTTITSPPDYYAVTRDDGLFLSTTSAKTMHKFLKKK